MYCPTPCAQWCFRVCKKIMAPTIIDASLNSKYIQNASALDGQPPPQEGCPIFPLCLYISTTSQVFIQVPSSWNPLPEPLADSSLG